MNKPGRILLPLALTAACFVSCGKSPSREEVTILNLAPPGPVDIGPATGLSNVPADAIVFDLKYVPQTGAKGECEYHSYWGYGGSTAEAKTNSFLLDVAKKASNLQYDKNPSFKGREWAAVEYRQKEALAVYFDLNADGKFQDNERIVPTRKAYEAVEFITPDFMNRLDDGRQMLCRAMMQVRFYSDRPQCMWSPASVVQGTAKLNGRATRLLLWSSHPGGPFTDYGSSGFSLLDAGQSKTAFENYVPRETLSSLVSNEGEFYHLGIDGLRSNGLPARAVLVKDTTPRGTLAVKLACSNSLHASFSSLYLQGVGDKTVVLRVSSSQGKVSLPEGTYAINDGTTSYGASAADEWEMSFTKGPLASITSNQVAEVILSEPKLTVRAVEERTRYSSQPVEGAVFKPGTRLYLEPKLVGKAQQVFTRFRHSGRDSLPSVTITDAAGKQLLSKNMEYG